MKDGFGYIISLPRGFTCHTKSGKTQYTGITDIQGADSPNRYLSTKTIHIEPKSHIRVFLVQQQDVQLEGSVMVDGRQDSAVFFGNVGHALHAEAVPIRVAAGLGQAIHEFQALVAGVFKVNGQHVALLGSSQNDIPLPSLWERRYGVDGVGKCIIEQRVQIQLVQEAEIYCAQVAGHGDAPLQAKIHFFHQNHIQNLIVVTVML